jgi:hypothetical protein
MAKMNLFSPKILMDKVGKNGDLIVSYADFGHIPYGHTLVGRGVFIAENEYGCDSYGNSLKQFDDPNPIVFIKRGECSYVQKVRNAEHGGSKLAVIVDEKNDENIKYIVMMNDGTGNGIIIPSVLLNKDPGNTIIDFLTSNEDSVTKNVKFMVNFKMNHPDNHVEYHLLLSTYQDRALDFVTDFKTFHERLGDNVSMTPHYFSWPCFGCDDEIKKEDCFGNGKYCAVDYNDLNMKGTDILLANIRQKCIYKNSLKNKQNDSDWWEYVSRAHASCYNDFTHDCSVATHEKLGIKWEDTEECVNNSFVNKGTDNEDNIILGEDYEFWVEGGFSLTPAVIINDIRYSGDMAADFVFEAVCAGFKDRPDTCDFDPLFIEPTIGSGHVSFNWLGLVTIILIVLNIILVAFCIKRNKVQLQTHVFSALGKYTRVVGQGNGPSEN